MMVDREAKRMKFGLIKRITEFPEEICVEIMARLPFRSIMRFKVVCKGWRKVIESSYFRRKFLFAHRNSSSSWSIMQGSFGWLWEEVVGFYGCERYELPRSLGSYIPPRELKDKNTTIACVNGLVLLRTISSGVDETYSVGNPVLNQWVQLPPHPSKGFSSSVIATGLVIRVEDDVIVEYKVVFMDLDLVSRLDETLSFDICSSETGTWIRKKVRCSHVIGSLNLSSCLSLNKKLHWLDQYERVLVAYDFFDADEQQQCQVTPFPHSEAYTTRTFTTSEGFIICITKIHLQLKLWKLKEYTSDSGRWELMQDINLTSFGCDHKYFPVAMDPFKTHIIYMSTWEEMTLVSIDLKTHKFIRHTKSSTYRDTMLSNYLSDIYVWLCRGHESLKVFYTPQFILPQWMGSVPLLPSM